MSGPTRAATVASGDDQDPRVQRTKAALRSAFSRLLLEHGYDAMTPAGIAADAGVGRSTFYDHFAGRAALLRHSVTIVLAPLADAAAGRDSPALLWVMTHFWDNRRFARRMIGGRPAVIVRNRLAELIEKAARAEGIMEDLPLPLVAAGKAASQLALTEAWLTGRHACTGEQLATAMVRADRRLARLSSMAERAAGRDPDTA